MRAFQARHGGDDLIFDHFLSSIFNNQIRSQTIRLERTHEENEEGKKNITKENNCIFVSSSNLILVSLKKKTNRKNLFRIKQHSSFLRLFLFRSLVLSPINHHLPTYLIFIPTETEAISLKCHNN